MDFQKITNTLWLILLSILSIYVYNNTIIKEANALSIEWVNTEIFEKTNDITNVQIHNNLCENLANRSNSEELLIKNNCDIEKTFKTIMNIKKWMNVKDLNTAVSRAWKSHAINVWIDRVNTMIDNWYSKERILDLLTIMTMECNKYNWQCFNWNDIWPMQINKIHDNPSKWKMWYSESWEFYNNEDWAWLFKYQLGRANELLDEYDADLCRKEYVIEYGLGNTYEAKKWRCVAFLYNGHPENKFAYNKLGWEKREIIKKYLEDNWIFKS